MEDKSATDLVTEHTPSALVSNENQPIDELFQLMSEVSPIAAAISETDVSDNEGCQLLLYDCLAHREKLLSWYSREKGRIGGGPIVCASSELLCTKIPPSEHLFRLPYRFSSLDNCRIHTVFWAVLSLLQALIGQAHSYAYTSGPVDINTNKEYQLSEYYADEISRAMPYCFQDSLRAWGVSITIFGMGQIAKVYMEFRREEKFMWSQELFKRAGDLGSDLAYRLRDLLQYGWGVVEKADREERHALSPVSSSSRSTASSASPVAEHSSIPETTSIPSRPKWDSTSSW